MATEEELKRALKAFKKRLKLTKLDEESGLSRGGGKKSGITGITPPTGHPPGIWDELVAKGKLKRDMGNTYALVPGADSPTQIPRSRFRSQASQSGRVLCAVGLWRHRCRLHHFDQEHLDKMHPFLVEYCQLAAAKIASRILRMPHVE